MVDLVGDPGLTVALEEVGDHVECLGRAPTSLKAKANKIHADEPDGLGRSLCRGPDLLVADRHAVSVHAVLSPPEPGWLREDP